MNLSPPRPWALREFDDFYALPKSAMSARERFYLWRFDHPFWHCTGGSSDGVFFCAAYGGDEWWRLGIIRPIHRVGRMLNEAKWWVLHRWHPRHRYNIVRTDLPPGYYDHDHRMLHGCMWLLGEFLEYDRHAEDEAKTEARAIWEWWTTERVTDQRRHTELGRRVYGDPRMKLLSGKPNEQGLVQVIAPPTPADLVAARNEYRTLGEKIANDEQAYLHRLIDIRRTLWT